MFEFRNSVLIYLQRLSIQGDNISDIMSTLVNTTPQFPELSSNAVQALYHAVRVDLGIIRPNQIYSSPTLFNASISEIHPDEHGNSETNRTRVERSPADRVGVDVEFNRRVPNILYLTSMLKPKPLGQAIASVFVATFSMLTALWAACSFIASSFVTVRSKEGQHMPNVYPSGLLISSSSNILSLPCLPRFSP
jgi:hypothetical protein